MLALHDVNSVLNTEIVRSAGTAIARRINPALLASVSSDGGDVFTANGYTVLP